MELATLHPPVTHFPIALLMLGSAAGLLYRFGKRRAELPVLTWWPLRLGWLGAALAVLTGLLAQSGLPPQAPYTTTLNWHIGTGMALLLLYAVVLYRQWLWNARRAKRPQDDAPDHLASPQGGLTALLLAADIVLVAAVGWLGGVLVYTWGVNTPGA
jgi:uncharacterized membrane protein